MTFPGTLTAAPASASAPFTIFKQDTSLVFSPTVVAGQYSDPINVLTELRDASGRRLASKTVFFLAESESLRASAPLTPASDPQAKPIITDYSGRAPLGDLPAPAGSYTLSVYFVGDIPLGNGQILSLDDLRYNATTAATAMILSAEDASVTYTGAVTGAVGLPLTLAASVTQADDGAPGDLTQAIVRFDLDLLNHPQSFYLAPVGPDGAAIITITAPAAGTYQVTTAVVGGYFTSPVTAGPTIIISEPTAIRLDALSFDPGLADLAGLAGRWTLLAVALLALLSGGWLLRGRKQRLM